MLSHGPLKLYSTCHSPVWPTLTTDVKMETLINLTPGQAIRLSCILESQTHRIKYSKELLQAEKNKISISASFTMMCLSLLSSLPQPYFPLLLPFSTPNSFTASHSGLALCIQFLLLIPLCPLPTLPAPFWVQFFLLYAFISLRDLNNHSFFFDLIVISIGLAAFHPVLKRQVSKERIPSRKEERDL